MATFNSGDTVQIVAREQTSGDIKSALYFNHYGNLTGQVLKVYGEEASVLVDQETLPKAILDRHKANETAMRQKWLDGLSDEGRNRLTSSEKRFALNYAILVHVNDLVPHTKRLSSADLEAAEEAALKARTK